MFDGTRISTCTEAIIQILRSCGTARKLAMAISLVDVDDEDAEAQEFYRLGATMPELLTDAEYTALAETAAAGAMVGVATTAAQLQVRVCDC